VCRAVGGRSRRAGSEFSELYCGNANENPCRKNISDATSKEKQMRNLSDALIDLAGRVKRVEDSAAAVQERNRAALQSRREELETAIEESKIELEAAATQAKDATRGWWSETTRSIQADFAEWQAETKKKNAERDAGDAEDDEDDAVVAVRLAAYCLDAAEWAVVRAELARGEADQLMGQGH
jgi:chromosome segregation ATPase